MNLEHLSTQSLRQLAVAKLILPRAEKRDLLEASLIDFVQVPMAVDRPRLTGAASVAGYLGDMRVSPSRSPGSGRAKARCSERCAGYSCDRDSAVAPVYHGRHWRA